MRIVYVRMRSLSVDYGYIILMCIIISLYYIYINYLNELINLLQTLLGCKAFSHVTQPFTHQSSQVTPYFYRALYNKGLSKAASINRKIAETIMETQYGDISDLKRQ